jgi:hypothetical protein
MGDITILWCERELIDVMDEMEKTMGRQYSMKINKRKTNILVCSRDEIARTQVKINDKVIE